MGKGEEGAEGKIAKEKIAGGKIAGVGKGEEGAFSAQPRTSIQP